MLFRRLIGILLLVASFALAALVIRDKPWVEHEIRTLGPFAYPLAIAVFALVASAPFSVTDALAIMNGVIFGPVRGSLVNAVGLVLAGMFGYWINLHATRLMDLDRALERLPKWAKRFPVGSPGFLISVRIIPGLGGTIATATAAAMRVPMWIHVLCMCVVAVPICTALAIGGDRVTAFVHMQERRAGDYMHRHHPRFQMRSFFVHLHKTETPKP